MLGTSRSAQGHGGARPRRRVATTRAARACAVGCTVLALAAGAGCGRQSGDSGEEASPGKPDASGGTGGPTTVAGATETTGTDDRVFPGGEALSDYRGLESYEWRVNAVDNTAELESALQAVDPSLGEDDFVQVIGTCEDLLSGSFDPEDLAEQTAERFGVDDPEQGQALVEAAQQYACP